MLEASCHCGAVRIEIADKPDTLTQCNCSICRRYGALWAYCTRQTARVLTGPEVETSYIWNDRVIEFYHCKTCGCMTRYEDVEKNADSRIAVNARMLEPEAIEGISMRYFDGAKTWKVID